MKTLTKNNISLYLFDDSKSLSITTNNIIVGDPAEFIIADCNISNTFLHENVEAPADWKGHKYLYDGEWSSNPAWVEPEIDL